MAATYSTVSTAIPSAMRTTVITEIEVGDQVDVTAILGRPARGIKFVTTDPADEISYKLNHRLTLLRKRADANGAIAAWMRESVKTWSVVTAEFTSVGEEISTVDGLKISAFELTDATLSTGSTISAVIW